MTDKIIYLDNQATTRVDPRVVEAMLPVFDQSYANAGSVTHELGLAASDLVEESAESIANCLNARRSEIVFTSGATESNNLAIRGACLRKRTSGHIITVETEHKAVLDPIAKLEKQGFRVTRLKVVPNGSDDAGLINLDELKNAIAEDTILVSVMVAHNEIGVIQPIREIADLCHECGVLLHTDATQAVGHLSVDVDELGVDLMSFSAHKFYGPKGIGGLYVRRTDRRVRLASQIDGGGQQENRRSGTLNVPGIVGMAAAGVEPRIMGIGPVPATRKVLARTGLTIDQMDVIELNEAFASQGLATLRELGVADDAPHVNPNGGAIALGHPLGMSGARLVLTAAYQLQRTGGRYALCTMCVGVGQGTALILERV